MGGDPAVAATLTLAHRLQPLHPLPASRQRNDGMLRLQEAAEYLGYTVKGLRNLVARTRGSLAGAETEGPTIHFFQATKGGPILFRKEWLDQFVREHQVDACAYQPAPPRPARRTGAARTAKSLGFPR